MSTIIHRTNPDPTPKGHWRCCRCRKIFDGLDGNRDPKEQARQCAINDLRKQKRRAAKGASEAAAAAPAPRPPRAARKKPAPRQPADKSQRRTTPRDELDYVIPPCSELDFIYREKETA